MHAPSLNRHNQQAVQTVGERIHELNFATIALYRTAVYLALGQRVLQELSVGHLQSANANSDNLIRLLSAVRTNLNGVNGEGIIDDLQDLIGWSTWSHDGTVIGYYDFRERLLSSQGWEQFTDLFRFYVHFHWKIETEVKNSADSLAQ